MKVFGLDFTSAPTAVNSKARRQKHLTLAIADLIGAELRVENLHRLNDARAGDYAPFERWLTTPGPWIAGLDFPFAQPRELVEACGWPTADWSASIDHVRRLGKAAFEAALVAYCAGQPPGSKHRRRPVDVWAKSISPMMLHGVPVGKMFWQGAPRLLDSPASIPILRPIAGESRTVVEAYPGLVARRWLDRRPYKHDDPNRDDTTRRAARLDLVRAIQGDPVADRPSVTDVYGLAVILPPNLAAGCVADATGDQLDSVLCALQAAWSHTQVNSGLPTGIDPLEGWIADPGPLL